MYATMINETFQMHLEGIGRRLWIPRLEMRDFEDDIGPPSLGVNWQCSPDMGNCFIGVRLYLQGDLLVVTFLSAWGRHLQQNFKTCIFGWKSRTVLPCTTSRYTYFFTRVHCACCLGASFTFVRLPCIYVGQV